MTWWVFSFLDNYRPPHALTVLAATEQRAHMFMKWSTIKPRRHKIWRRFRGTDIWCGYQYIWDTPNLVEQAQPGDTQEHLFGPIPLAPADHVWYYLFSWFRPELLEHQGPLIHVPPPELPMPSARIFHSVAQAIPTNVFTILTFDSVLFDDYDLYDPADPTKLTIPAGALYAFGANARLATVAPAEARFDIFLNGTLPIVYHAHNIGPTGWGGAGLSLHSIWAFRPGDFIQCRIYHTAGLARDVTADDHYSPHFWIAQIGAYPVSPP